MTAVHLPGYTGTPREAVVDGLRALADAIAADDRLPLGRDLALGVPLSLTVMVDNAHEVHELARAYDVPVDVTHNAEGSYYTVAALRFGPVLFRVMHVAHRVVPLRMVTGAGAL